MPAAPVLDRPRVDSAAAAGVTRLAAAGIVGYLLGTVPSADVAARLATGGSTDLRTEGSGNPGGLNAAKVLGARWGYGVMAADIVKGAAATGIGRRLAGAVGAHLGGTAAVVGHCHPVWNRFRGGKGVAASVGYCVVGFPAYFPLDLVVAAATAASPRWRQRAFAATAAASVSWVLAGIVWWRRGWANAWGPPATVALPIGAAVSSAVILGRFAAGAQRGDDPEVRAR